MSNQNKNRKKNTKQRVFAIVDYPNVDELYGNFTGSSPSVAADKVLTLLAEKIDLKNTDEKNFIFFTIRDITDNVNNNVNNVNSVNNNSKKNKEYSYIGTRVELYEPIKLKNGRIIKFRNNMTRVTNKNMHIYNIEKIEEGNNNIINN